MDTKPQQDIFGQIGLMASSESSLLELWQLNEELKETGAYLSESGIRDVLISRQKSLRGFGRLQWSLAMTEKLMIRASESRYVEKDSMVSVLTDWHEILYDLQNHIDDFYTDEEVIQALTLYYDHYCSGDMEFLRGRGVDRILNNAKRGVDLSLGYDERPDIAQEDAKEDAESSADLATLSPSTDFPLDAEHFAVPTFSVREPSVRPHDGDSSHKALADTAEIGGGRDLFALLRDELSRYAGDGVTSVKEVTARRIFDSIRYTIRLAGDVPGSDERLFHLGQYRLREILAQAGELYRDTLSLRLHLPLDTFYGSVYREVPLFFRKYDPQYAAHEAPCLLDYPPAIEITDLEGILYMKEYLRRIRIECMYASRIPESLCADLIEAYGDKYHMQITSFPISFFDILMSQAYSAAILLEARGENPENLWTDSEEAPNLWLQPSTAYDEAIFALRKLSPARRILRLNKIVKAVSQFPGESEDTVAYANEFGRRWIETFEAAFENHCERNMILERDTSEKIAGNDTVRFFAEGTPMENEAYTELLEKLASADGSPEQIRLIRESVHSKQDLLDLLREDFWLSGEKENFLLSLTPEEKAMLSAETVEADPLFEDR